MRSLGIWLCLTVGLAVSCGPAGTSTDRERLLAVGKQFGGRYELSLEKDTYVRAKSLTDASPTREEAIRIYRAFWFDGSQPRTDTSYTYLNVYDHKEEFQFQVFLNPSTRQIEFSHTDHY